MSQSFQEFKWLIIDGNSTDGSIEFIKSLQFEKLNIIIEDDKGIYDAMNKSIRYILPDDLVWFINSGDIIFDRTILNKLMYVENQNDIVFGDYAIKKPNESLKRIKIIRNPLSLNFVWLIKKTLNHQSYLIKGKFINSYRFNEKYSVCADWVQLFSILTSKEEIKIVKIPFPISIYELGGFSSNHENLRIEERNRFLASIYSESVLQQLQELSSIISKKYFSQLLSISRSKYRVRLLYLFIKLISK